MGRRLTASEETRALQEATRTAHEALKELKAAMREAAAMTTLLVREYQDTHRAEIKALSNYFIIVTNRQSAELNESVEAARQEIMRQLTTSSLEIGEDGRTLKVVFGGRRFDDRQPIPYPKAPVWKDTE